MGKHNCQYFDFVQGQCTLLTYPIKNDNNKRTRHVIKILVFQTTVSIVSYLRVINLNVSSKRSYLKRKDQKPFLQMNEFSFKSMANEESFSCLALTATLKRNLFHSVMLLQIGLNQYLTFFCRNQYLLAYFSLIKNCQVHQEKDKIFNTYG